jgi:hypothetical protein
LDFANNDYCLNEIPSKIEEVSSINNLCILLFVIKNDQQDRPISTKSIDHVFPASIKNPRRVSAGITQLRAEGTNFLSQAEATHASRSEIIISRAPGNVRWVVFVKHQRDHAVSIKVVLKFGCGIHRFRTDMVAALSSFDGAPEYTDKRVTALCRASQF